MLGRVIVGNTNIFKLRCFLFRIISPFTLPWSSNEVWQKCVFAHELWFSVWYWESFYGKQHISQMHLIKRKISFEREGGGALKLGHYLFWQSLAKNAEATRGALLTQENKQSSAAFCCFSVISQILCFLLSFSPLYRHHWSWWIPDITVSRRVGNDRQRLLPVTDEPF